MNMPVRFSVVVRTVFQLLCDIYNLSKVLIEFSIMLLLNSLKPFKKRRCYHKANKIKGTEDFKIDPLTRMHSSRMRTARSLNVSHCIQKN